MISLRAEIEKRGKFLTDSRALDIYRQGVIRGGVEAADHVLSEVVRRTPVGETGALYKGWQKSARLGIPFQGLVFNQVTYGEIVEKGSRAHTIRPRWKKALAFIPGGGPGRTTWAERLRSGETIFVRRVQHPGTKPRRFVAQTLQDIAGSAAWRRLWDSVVAKIIQEMEQ